jgi:hypothetical protein
VDDLIAWDEWIGKIAQEIADLVSSLFNFSSS